MSSSQKSSSKSKKDETTNPDLNLTSIGNYSFVKTLGEGNFAKVKLAKHKLTSAEVAIKIIDKTTLDEKKLGKLYREVRIMKMLHHPNIVKLYEVIETKSTMFLVMEYSSGGELYDYLVVHGKMKEKEARAKFRQILSAVGYCHKKRVIHRDLKAENLLLDANLDIKIADFGFSNVFDPDSKLDTFCGSPPYAAPELFQGRRYTGPEVDIWSLGVILYVLTTGCLPFDGKNLQDMRESVCKGKYRIPFYLSDGCEKLLRKMLVRDPAKRASLDIFIDDPWINDGYDHSPIVKDVSLKIEEDDNIIRLIEAKYHLDKAQISQSLRDNVYDDISAIYYLLYYEKETRGRIESDSPVSTHAPMLPLHSSHASNNSHHAPPASSGDHHNKSSSANSNVGTTAASSSSATASSEANKSGTFKVAPMAVIAEDGPGNHDHHQNNAHIPGTSPSRQEGTPSKPNRRRFTVGTDADVQKYAEDDEEAAKLLSKLQQANNTSSNAQNSSSTHNNSTNTNNGLSIQAAGANGQTMINSSTSYGTSKAQVRSQTANSTTHRSVAETSNLLQEPIPSDSTVVNDPIVQTRSNVIDSQSDRKSMHTSKDQAPVTQPHPLSIKTEAKSNINNNNSGENSNTAIDSTDKTQTRKRHNTIVGILRNTLYRDAPQSPTMAVISPSVEKGGDMIGGSTQASQQSVNDSEAFEPVKPGDEGKPRSLRFTFSSNTTSTKPPDDIIKEVMSTCANQNVQHKLASRYLVECQWFGGKENPEEGVKFDIEVCRLPRLKNLHGLRFKRTSGSSNDYKEICEKLVATFQL